MHRTRTRLAAAVGILAVMGVAAACVPPPAPVSESWTFRATQVTVNDSQDEVRVFGACANFNCEDEPYTLNIGFRAKIGQAGSAQAFVVNNRTDAPENIDEGQTVALNGNAQNAVTFNNIKPLDVIDLVNTNNKLEIVGVYTWASEEDFTGNGVAADTVANLFEDALNATVAAGSLPSDPSFILDLVLDNLLGALGLIGNQLLNISIPLLGDVGDDVLGGGLYIGIGAKGSLASIIDGATASTPPITFNIPVVNIVPDITGGGFFTMSGPKTFNQTFTGDDGQHTYQFSVSKN
jgi:cytochrome c-type biogenesis protein CcmE